MMVMIMIAKRTIVITVTFGDYDGGDDADDDHGHLAQNLLPPGERNMVVPKIQVKVYSWIPHDA